ncbi:MAG TPA: hypothetical protein ENI69_02445 [Rhodospirillales bacterium]|nr:hypothetical protein [Rhodospirillales bacterium]
MNDKVQNNSAKTVGRGAVRQSERRTRQAQSLRDNLKKRKQQVRSRDTARDAALEVKGKSEA